MRKAVKNDEAHCDETTQEENAAKGLNLRPEGDTLSGLLTSDFRGRAPPYQPLGLANVPLRSVSVFEN